MAEIITKERLEDESTPVGRSPLYYAWRDFLRNKAGVSGLVFIILILLIAVFAPHITPYPYAYQNNSNARADPMTGYDITVDELQNCHWAGTPMEWGCALFLTGSDSLGRDLWSRTVYGTRVSLAVGFVAALVSLLIGTIYGIFAGFSGGRVDNFMMRIVDFLYAVPLLPIIILLQVYFRALARQGVTEGVAGAIIGLNQDMGGMLFLFFALGALNWVGMSRLARGQVLYYKEREFVVAARSVGASSARIMFVHLLPNIVGPLLIAETLAIPGYIFTEAVLSFIGLGVNPPTPSWGQMISDGYQGLRSNPHLVLVPGAALTLLTLAFNFMGDSLRDAVDPRMRGRR
jgi:oligopeptide transport system permease protein